MYNLHIEHTATDYEQWKRMFDSDPLDRKASGVHSFQVMRPVDDASAVIIDLTFDDRDAAMRMKAALEELWKGPAGEAIRDPRARLVEVVEKAEL